MKKFLEGIKVVGFETAGAGPIATRLLAEHGAEVILIEPISGVNTRPQVDFDFFFMHKKSVAVNMKSSEGFALVEKLISQADVFVSNYRKKAIDKFGLDYETLHAKYPRLIHATLTGYGEKGPMKDAPGFDTTAYWGRAGLAKSVRERNGDPIVTPSALGDIACGTILFGGIMSALYNRERTGEGMKVFISLMGLGIWQNNGQMLQTQFGYEYPLSRKTPRRAYANTYLLKDGYFHFHTLAPERDMPKICKMIGRPELAEDPAYCEHWLDSGEWAANMRAIMDEGFGKMTVQEAKDKFREYDLAFGEICGPDDVLKDPQALENNMLAPHTTLRGDHVMFATSPLKFEDDSPCEDAPAPRLGQHTTEIMRMAGYSDEEILAMSEAGIVRSE